MLMWFPVLWLVLIPANFLIDFLVTRFTMKHLLLEDYHERAWKHSWKICLIGFLSDFIGAVFIFTIYYMTLSASSFVTFYCSYLYYRIIISRRLPIY